jgi:hypothetical protein
MISLQGTKNTPASNIQCLGALLEVKGNKKIGEKELVVCSVLKHISSQKIFYEF